MTIEEFAKQYAEMLNEKHLYDYAKVVESFMEAWEQHNSTPDLKLECQCLEATWNFKWSGESWEIYVDYKEANEAAFQYVFKRVEEELEEEPDTLYGFANEYLEALECILNEMAYKYTKEVTA